MEIVLYKNVVNYSAPWLWLRLMDDKLLNLSPCFCHVNSHLKFIAFRAGEGEAKLKYPFISQARNDRLIKFG